MSVQTSYRLYQNEKGIGVIGENNPYDIGAFVTGDVSKNAIHWGCFVVRASSTFPRDILAPAGSASKIIGATTKQEDRVEGQFGGIVKDTSSNSGVSFTLSEGRPASIMRMGYLNMPCATGTWVAGLPVYVKVLLGTGTDDGFPLGSVSNIKTADATKGTYEALSAAVFADSSNSGAIQQVAKVFFDTRIPVATTANTAK